MKKTTIKKFSIGMNVKTTENFGSTFRDHHEGKIVDIIHRGLQSRIKINTLDQWFDESWFDFNPDSISVTEEEHNAIEETIVHWNKDIRIPLLLGNYDGKSHGTEPLCQLFICGECPIFRFYNITCTDLVWKTFNNNQTIKNCDAVIRYLLKLHKNCVIKKEKTYTTGSIWEIGGKKYILGSADSGENVYGNVILINLDNGCKWNEPYIVGDLENINDWEIKAMIGDDVEYKFIRGRRKNDS